MLDLEYNDWSILKNKIGLHAYLSSAGKNLGVCFDPLAKEDFSVHVKYTKDLIGINSKGFTINIKSKQINCLLYKVKTHFNFLVSILNLM